MLGTLVSTVARLKRSFTTPRFAVAAAEHHFVAAATVIHGGVGFRRGRGERNRQAKCGNGRAQDLFQHGSNLSFGDLFASTLPQEKRRRGGGLRAAFLVITAF